MNPFAPLGHEPMNAPYTGGSPSYYERDGRRFVASGIGTIGWGVYTMYREVDIEGNVIDRFSRPLEWIFPDPAATAEEQRKEAERQSYLNQCALDFPVEGMSGAFNDNSMEVWRTPSGDALQFEIRACAFCDKETQCLYMENDWVAHGVCRTCLGKMFDAFETHEGENE